jgi:hypothetical protein
MSMLLCVILDTLGFAQCKLDPGSTRLFAWIPDKATAFTGMAKSAQW